MAKDFTTLVFLAIDGLVYSVLVASLMQTAMSPIYAA